MPNVLKVIEIRPYSNRLVAGITIFSPPGLWQKFLNSVNFQSRFLMNKKYKINLFLSSYRSQIRGATLKIFKKSNYKKFYLLLQSFYSDDNDFRPVPILSITVPLASLGVIKCPIDRNGVKR